MYNKKKYGLKKLTALLIILIFAFCTLGNSVAYSNSLTEKSMLSSIGDTENASLNRSDVPELIEYDTALEKGHVERNRANEPDLYTVSFKNADKSETMYLFAEPVKYVEQLFVHADNYAAHNHIYSSYGRNGKNYFRSASVSKNVEKRHLFAC